MVAGIETHRSGLERRLGRDPGFVVAAVDFLQGTDGRAWHRAAPAGARASARDAPGREPVGSFEEDLAAELRRCRRSRRPLSLILLVPVQNPGREALDRAEAALAEALRDSDRLGRLVPPAFAIALPESGAAAASRAAARLGRIAARAAAAPFRCGLSVAGAVEDDGEALLSAARRAVEHEPIDPETDAFPERRRHRRSPAAGVRARLLCDDSTRDTEVLDLSSVGARVRDGDVPEGTAVRLSLLGPSPRAAAATLPARVASRRAAPDGGQAVLIFDEGDAGLAELATLLSGLPRAPREGRS
jgi:hypothetical protein